MANVSSAYKPLRWCAYIGAAFHCMVYLHERLTRRHLLPACEWEVTIPDDHRIPYIAKWCMLAQGNTLIRIFDRSGQKLLAELTLTAMDIPSLYGETHRLSSINEGVSLPPTALDWIRARMP